MKNPPKDDKIIFPKEEWPSPACRQGFKASGITMFYVYILKSLRDNGFYVGRTKNLDRRIKEHNAGFVSSTKSRRPLVLLQSFSVDTEQDSVKLEREYKKGYRREILKHEFGL